MRKYSSPVNLFLLITLALCGPPLFNTITASPSQAQAPARPETPPIITASQRGDVAKIRELLTDATQANATDAGGDTPLHKILLNSDNSFVAAKKEMVTLLLEKGASVQARNRRGNTPLHYAARSYGEPAKEIVELLLQRNADVKARDRDGNTPLHFINHPGAVQPLVAKGADLNAVNADGNTPLHNAVFAGNGPVDVIKVMLAAGANPNVRNAAGDLPVHLHLRRRGYIVEPLLLEKSDLTQRDSHGLTSVQAALLNGDVALLQSLVALRPKVDEATAFFLSVAQNDVETLKQQIQAKPHMVHTRLPGGETPLHIAARWLAIDTIRYLLSMKADVNGRDAAARTPLHDISRWFGSEKRAVVRQIVEVLLAAGADPDAMSHAGNTPLHQALSTEDQDLVLALLKGGANPTLRNWRGQTALHLVVSEIAVHKFATALVPLLIARGADINALGSVSGSSNSSPGASPLILLVDDAGRSSSRDTPLLATLLQNNARLDVQNDAGDTALHAAARRNKIDVLKQLLSVTDKSLALALHLRNLKGQTALGVALEAKRSEAAELLRAAGAKE